MKKFCLHNAIYHEVILKHNPQDCKINVFDYFQDLLWLRLIQLCRLFSKINSHCQTQQKTQTCFCWIEQSILLSFSSAAQKLGSIVKLVFLLVALARENTRKEKYVRVDTLKIRFPFLASFVVTGIALDVCLRRQLRVWLMVEQTL